MKIGYIEFSDLSTLILFSGSISIGGVWQDSISIFLDNLTLTSSQKLTSAIVAPTTGRKTRNNKYEKRRERERESKWDEKEREDEEEIGRERERKM